MPLDVREVPGRLVEHAGVDGAQRGGDIGDLERRCAFDRIGRGHLADAVGRGAQPAGELVLDVGLKPDEAVEAELRREAHDRRAARACAVGDLRDGAERDALRLAQHHFGDAALGGSEVRLAIVDALRGRH